MVATYPRLVPALIRVCIARPFTVVVALTAALAGCATARGPVSGTPPPRVPQGTVQTGLASWYGERHQGRRTASGELYDMYRFTAAHRVLPLGTLVLVTNLGNGRSVEVRVNDRGPTVAGRIIDVSSAAARSGRRCCRHHSRECSGALCTAAVRRCAESAPGASPHGPERSSEWTGWILESWIARHDLCSSDERQGPLWREHLSPSLS